MLIFAHISTGTQPTRKIDINGKRPRPRPKRVPCQIRLTSKAPYKSASANGAANGADRMVATQLPALVDFRRAGIPCGEHEKASLIVSSKMRLRQTRATFDADRRLASCSASASIALCVASLVCKPRTMSTSTGLINAAVPMPVFRRIFYRMLEQHPRVPLRRGQIACLWGDRTCRLRQSVTQRDCVIASQASAMLLSAARIA